MEETVDKDKEQVLQRPKEPKLEDFGLTENRISELEEGPSLPFFKIGIIIGLIFAILLGLKVASEEPNEFSLGVFLLFMFSGGLYVILLIAVAIAHVFDGILERFFPSFKENYYQSWLAKQPDYKAFVEYKKAKEKYEKELTRWLDQRQRIRESRQRKISSSLIEYTFPIGLKVYYPSSLTIIKDDLDKEESNSPIETLFVAVKVNSSILRVKDIFKESCVFTWEYIDIIIEVLRNLSEEFVYRIMINRPIFRIMINKLIQEKGYVISDNKENKKHLTTIYIKGAIDNFLKGVQKPLQDENIAWNKLIEAKKFGDDAVIWIEKLKFKNSNKLFIRTSKYLLHANENDFYAITINTYVSSKVYGENIDLIKTIIEKSGFEK
jgi:hypothetical protein